MASSYQRAKRLAFWKFYGYGLAVFSLLAGLSGLVDRISNGVPL
ncbi:hypothetical protein [Stutzerimonas balearica]|nr:hypothetical protein [Stutzerimonas balearica]